MFYVFQKNIKPFKGWKIYRQDNKTIKTKYKKNNYDQNNLFQALFFFRFIINVLCFFFRVVLRKLNVEQLSLFRKVEKKM